ncbi:hypothetical protein AAG570_000107 [Ranatra chinensis]|uniref:Uncharacterized protein n=1 Tax=Ranatra chinensis TaxID=642074 RepID=A0ABD0YW48_9HEMI
MCSQNRYTDPALVHIGCPSDAASTLYKHHPKENKTDLCTAYLRVVRSTFVFSKTLRSAQGAGESGSRIEHCSYVRVECSPGERHPDARIQLILVRLHFASCRRTRNPKWKFVVGSATATVAAVTGAVTADTSSLGRVATRPATTGNNCTRTTKQRRSRPGERTDSDGGREATGRPQLCCRGPHLPAPPRPAPPRHLHPLPSSPLSPPPLASYRIPPSALSDEGSPPPLPPPSTNRILPSSAVLVLLSSGAPTGPYRRRSRGTGSGNYTIRVTCTDNRNYCNYD